jgi:hypothetical protein
MGKWGWERKMMIPATFTVAGVVERDIDLLLLEEFLSSELFSRWFIEHALHPPGPSNNLGQVRRAGRSVTQSMGESDLEIVFEAADGSRTYLLIENKVNAVFQPAQAERYHLRGRTYLERGDCIAVFTVLVAPARYFGSASTCQGFDGRLSYEALRDWFLEQHGMGPRRLYKAGFLAAAIEKAHYGYQAEADALVTTFWRAYWELAVTEAPELQMDMPPPKPAGAGFVRFRPAGIAAPVSLIHKLRHGCVDLQVTGWANRLAELHAVVAPYLEPDMQVVRAAKASAIRLRVPALDTGRSFVEQIEAVRTGQQAAQRLLGWFRDHPQLSEKLD